jgi:hypothetical protein
MRYYGRKDPSYRTSLGRGELKGPGTALGHKRPFGVNAVRQVGATATGFPSKPDQLTPLKSPGDRCPSARNADDPDCLAWPPPSRAASSLGSISRAGTSPASPH